MKHALWLAATVTVSACTGPAPADSSTIAVTYHCANGDKLLVSYDRRQETATLATALLAPEDTTLTLPRQISGSGFIYSDGEVTLRGKGQEVQLQAGRRAPVSCMAQ